MLHLRLLEKNIITIHPVPESMPEAQDFVESVLEKAGVPQRTRIKMNIAVDEIFSNIIRYSGAAEAKIECAVLNGKVTLTFTDNGKPYDPTQAEDPDISLGVEEREVGGLGIFMVKKSMDRVNYVYREKRNILKLEKIYEV